MKKDSFRIKNILFLVVLIAGCFANFKAKAQLTPSSTVSVCVTRQDGSKTPYTSLSDISACFDPDIMNVTLTFTNFPENQQVDLSYGDAPLYFDGKNAGDISSLSSGWPAGFTSIYTTPSGEHHLFIKNVSADNSGTGAHTYTGTITFTVSFTQCCNIGLSTCVSGCSTADWTNGVFSLKVDASDGTAINYPAESSCGSFLGSYETTTGGANVGSYGVHVYKPLLSFVTDIPSFYTANSLTLTADMLKNYSTTRYMIFDKSSRYYIIKAVSGASDFFKLTIAAENDADISAVSVINADGSNVFTIPGSAIAHGNTGTITFNAGTTSNPGLLNMIYSHQTTKTIHDGYLFADPSLTNSDYLILKEDFQVMDVTANQGCGIAASATSYTLGLFCDKAAPAPCCSVVQNLNVQCLFNNYPGFSATITDPLNSANSKTIDMCDPDSKVDFNLIISNNNDVATGMVQLGPLYIPINSTYFTFDGVYLDNVLLTNGVEYTYHAGDAGIQINSYPNLQSAGSGTDLTYQLPNGNYPVGADPATSPYSFLPGKSSCTFTVKGLKFNCPASGVITDPYSLSNLNGISVFFRFNGVCGMVNRGTSQENSYAFNATNTFAGTATASCDDADITVGGSHPHPKLNFKFVPNTAVANVDPLTLFLGANKLLACPGGEEYWASIDLPNDIYIGDDLGRIITIYNNTDSHNITSTTVDLDHTTTDIFSLISTNTGSHTYRLDYGKIAGFNVSNVSIQFGTTLICSVSGSFGQLFTKVSFFAQCACSSACPRLLGSDEVPLFSHCQGDCVSMLSIGDFSFKRNTFGWVPPTGATVDVTQPSTINLAYAEANKLRLDRVYECDHVHATAPGVLNNWIDDGSVDGAPRIYPSDFGNYSFQFAYKFEDNTKNVVINNLFTPNPSSSCFATFHFVLDSKCKDYCINHSITIPSELESFDVEIPPTSYSVSLGSASNITNCIIVKVTIPSDAVIQGTADNFYGKLSGTNFKFDVTFDGEFVTHDFHNFGPGVYPTSFMQGDFVCNGTSDWAPQGNNHTCDPFGSKMTFLKLTPVFVGDGIFNSNSTAVINVGLCSSIVSSCIRRYVGAYSVKGGYLNEQDFPGEFRPYFYFSPSLNFNLPAGVRLLDAKFYDSDHPYNTCNPTSIPGVPANATGSISIPIDKEHRPLPDRDQYNQYVGVELVLGISCFDNPADVKMDIPNTILTAQAYTMAYPDNQCFDKCLIPVLPSTTASPYTILAASTTHNDISVSAVGGTSATSIGSSVNVFSTNPVIDLHMSENEAGNELENAWIYIDPVSEASVNVTGGNVTAVGSGPTIYKISAVSGDGGFTLLHLGLTLSNCLSTGFDLVVHYGYNCDPAFAGDISKACYTGTYTIHVTPVQPDLQSFFHIAAISPVVASGSTTPCNNQGFEYKVTIQNLTQATPTNQYNFCAIVPEGFTYVPTDNNIIVTKPSGHDYYSLGQGTPSFVKIDGGTNVFCYCWTVTISNPADVLNNQNTFEFDPVFIRFGCPVSGPLPPLNPDMLLGSLFTAVGNCGLPISANPPTKTLTRAEHDDGVSLENLTYCCTDNDVLNITTTTTSACSSPCNGSITVSISNGVAPYYVAWSLEGSASSGNVAGSSSSTILLNGLCSGTYDLVVTDKSGSPNKITGIVVSSNPTPSASITESSTGCGPNAGSLDLTPSGGTPTYSYNWSTGFTGEDPGSLAGGSYSVTVTDAKGCTIAATHAVTLSGLVIQTSMNPVTCNSTHDGSINLTAMYGHTPYTYNWTGPSSYASTLQNINGLYAGTYNVTVTDNSGCSVTASITVTHAATPTVTVTNGSLCVGQGQTTLTASGAVTYSWSPSTGLNTVVGPQVIATPSTTTNYVVTGTDANGCTGNATATVTVHPLPTLSFSPSNPSICKGNDVTITVSGALSYSWTPASSVIVSGDNAIADASPVTSTNYTVVGTSSYGCTASAVETVTVNAKPALTANSPVYDCPGAPVELDVSGATTYTWSPATGLNHSFGSPVIASPAQTTVYHVTGTDAGGCVASRDIEVIISSPVITFTPANPSVCLGSNVEIFASGLANYQWAPPDGLNKIYGNDVISTPTATIEYTISGTDGEGCTATNNVTVTVKPIPTVTASGGGTVCVGQSKVLSASGASTYTWYLSSTLSSATGTPVTATPPVTTTYTVTGSNSYGCTASDIAVVIVSPCTDPCSTLSANFTYDPVNVSPNPINFHSTSTTSGSIIGYYWNFGDGSSGSGSDPKHSYALAGTYRVCMTTAVLGSDGKSCCDSVCKSVCASENGFNCDNYVVGFNMDLLSDNTVQYFNTTEVASGSIPPNYYWTFGDGSTSTQSDPVIHFTGSSPSFHSCLSIVDPATGLNCGAPFCRDIESRLEGSNLVTAKTTDFMFIDAPSATGNLKIEYKNICSSDAQVVIYNGSGEQKYESAVSPDNPSITVNIDTWASGYYSAKLFVDGQLLEVKRFSKN